VQSNWDLVCKPKTLGGLGILNLKSLPSNLRLRWLWNEWREDPKPWLGLGNPCNKHDRDLFVVATKVTIGNWKRALFWESSWLDGMRQKDIAPFIFDISKKRKCLVSKAMENEFWISQIYTYGGLTVEHIAQFTKLWEMAQNVQMDNDMTDKITWKFCNDGSYSSK
jgi:hypothetical protein